MTLVNYKEIIRYRIKQEEYKHTFDLNFDFEQYPTLAEFTEKEVFDDIILVIHFLDDFDEVEVRRVIHTLIKSKQESHTD